MTSAGSDARPGQAGQPADAGRAAPAPEQAVRPAVRPVPPEPVLSEQSREDTDIAWGDYPRRDDEDRLYRDRPPHWADH